MKEEHTHIYTQTTRKEKSGKRTIGSSEKERWRSRVKRRKIKKSWEEWGGDLQEKRRGSSLRSGSSNSFLFTSPLELKVKREN